MELKTIKVREHWRRKAKVASAEAGVSMATFVEQAIDRAVAEHNRLKTTVRRTTPVQFVGGDDGRG